MPSRLRPWLYALIPLGFIAFVGILLLIGQDTGGPTHSPYESGDILQTSESPEADAGIVDDPDNKTGEFVPTPSGPEYEDNETILE